MAVQQIDRLISGILDQRVDKEVAVLLSIATDLIENCGVVSESDREDAAMRFIFYMEDQDKEWRGKNPTSERLPPAYRTIQVLSNPNHKDKKLLKNYLRTIINETKQGQKDEEFRQWLVKGSENIRPEDIENHGETEQPNNGARRTIGLALGWISGVASAVVFVEAYLEVPVLATVDDLFGYLCNGGIASTAALSGIFVNFTTVHNLLLVAFKRRSWSRAQKEIIDVSASVITGNLIGIGTAVGLGAFLSLSTGGLFLVSAGISLLVTWVTREFISEWTFQWFNLPKNEGLEKAYNMLGVKQTDLNSVVNRAYRLKSREVHPDTLGKRDPAPTPKEMEKALQTFIKLQEAIDLIRESREKNGSGNSCGDEHEEAEVNWRVKIMLLIKRLNPWRSCEDNRTTNLLQIKYEIPPVTLFEESSVEPIQ